MSGPVPCCEVCGWSLAESRDRGCVQGDCSYRPPEGTDEWYRIRSRREALASAAAKSALHSAERAVLDACVEQSKAFDAVRARPGQLSALQRHTDAVRSLSIKVRSYRALLDAKAEGKGA